MTIELRWIASTAASSLHAAEAHLAGSTLVDKATAEAIAAPAEGLAEELAEQVIEGRDFFDQAIPLSVQHEPPQALAEVVVAKTLGADHAAAASKVAARLAALYAAFGQANPALDELELRTTDQRAVGSPWPGPDGDVRPAHRAPAGRRASRRDSGASGVGRRRRRRIRPTTRRASKRCWPTPSRRCPKWCGWRGSWLN